MNSSRRLLWLLLLVPVLLVALMVWRFSAPPSLDADSLRGQGFWLHPAQPRASIPRVNDHLGGSFDSDNLSGRWTLVFFGYTHCPDICGPSLALLRQARKLLIARGWSEDDLQTVMVGVDPRRDTPERMADFIGRRNPGMIGLLPDPARLLALATALHANYGDGKEEGLLDHTGNFVVLDPEGRYRGFFKPPATVDGVAGIMQLLKRVHDDSRR